MASLRTLALSLAAGIVLLGAGDPVREATGATPAPSIAALRICTGCAARGLDTGGRYHYVILQAWESGRISQLKAADPTVKVLVYKDVAATLDYTCSNGADDAQLPAGVGYCAANASHPEWFLKDTTGARIAWCDFPHAWQMDVANPAYQRQWLANVLASAKTAGFDGVLMDDVNETAAGHLCDRTIAGYPSVSDYTTAITSFMAAVAPALRANGLLAVPNIAIEDWWTPHGYAIWDRWLSFSSGAAQEYYSKWRHDTGGWFTDDGRWHDDWSSRQGFLTRTERAGKFFIGIAYAPAADVRSMRYARASFLLDWDGGPSALAFEPTNPESRDPYSGEWAADIGAPSAPRFRVGVAWRRNYSGGIVVLNPSPSSSQRVELGARFLLPDGSAVMSVTLPPTSALILRAAEPRRRLVGLY
jgi:putative glycosyl hydrolase-like family 15 (GHL15) protein